MGWEEPGGEYRIEPRREGPRSVASKVKVVCENHCNNGWMSRLETDVQPVLRPISQDNAREMPEDDQQLLAFWTSKTMMMFEYLADWSRATNKEQRRYLYEHREIRKPPPLTTVWIGAYAATEPLRRGYLHAGFKFARVIVEAGKVVAVEASEEAANTQQTTFVIGHVVLSIFSTSVPELRNATLNFGRDDGSLRKIWPSPGDFRWPFAGPLDDKAVENVAAAINGLGNMPRLGKRLPKRRD